MYRMSPMTDKEWDLAHRYAVKQLVRLIEEMAGDGAFGWSDKYVREEVKRLEKRKKSGDPGGCLPRGCLPWPFRG